MHNFSDVQSVLPAPTQDFVAPLTDYGLISISGEDAAQFLHQQITNDIKHLDQQTVRLAGYCSSKGRLLATFLVWRHTEHESIEHQFRLQLPYAILASIQKRFQTFVLRAKVKLTDLSADQVALGLVSNNAATVLNPWFATVPSQIYTKIENENGTLLRVSDSRQIARYQWITTLKQARAIWPDLITRLTATSAHAWHLAEIEAGIPHITAATQEQFIPQMVNFELIGGIHFKKGCYPGQEIVARTQYLGKIKRRTILALVDASAVQPGSEIFSSADPAQPCGQVVNAELLGPNTTLCLVAIKLAALQDGSIHLGQLNGPVLQLQSLPYRLPEFQIGE